jgi:uncharacterized alpha-E superfamily protein
MLSREAEALYWMGRYLERAEAIARRFDVQYHSRLEAESADSATVPWHALLFSSGDEAAYRERYGVDRNGALPEEHSLIAFLILDDENPNSIRACVGAARENARGIRDQISSEIWEHLNRFYLELGEQTLESVLSRTPYRLLQWVKCSCWLLDGIAERTMIRGEGWQFLQCGKFLERAESTARLLDGKSYAWVEADTDVAGAVDLHQWSALLKSVGAYEAFRKTYRGITPADVIAYVMLDARFPGAIRYSIVEVETALRAISGRSAAEDGNEAERCAGRLLASLTHARAPEVVARGLHAYLIGLVEECGALHGAIVRTFFSHLAWRPWEAEEPETAPPGGRPGGRTRGATVASARPSPPLADLSAPGQWQAMASTQ